MKNLTQWMMVLAIGLFGSAAFAADKDKDKDRDEDTPNHMRVHTEDMPKAVVEKFEEVTRDGKDIEYYKIREEGKEEHFAVEFKDKNGHEKEIHVTREGKVLKHEGKHHESDKKHD